MSSRHPLCRLGRQSAPACSSSAEWRSRRQISLLKTQLDLTAGSKRRSVDDGQWAEAACHLGRCGSGGGGGRLHRAAWCKVTTKHLVKMNPHSSHEQHSTACSVLDCRKFDTNCTAFGGGISSRPEDAHLARHGRRCSARRSRWHCRRDLRNMSHMPF